MINVELFFTICLSAVTLSLMYKFAFGLVVPKIVSALDAYYTVRLEPAIRLKLTLDGSHEPRVRFSPRRDRKPEFQPQTATPRWGDLPAYWKMADSYCKIVYRKSLTAMVMDYLCPSLCSASFSSPFADTPSAPCPSAPAPSRPPAPIDPIVLVTPSAPAPVANAPKPTPVANETVTFDDRTIIANLIAGLNNKSPEEIQTLMSLLTQTTQVKPEEIKETTKPVVEVVKNVPCKDN